MLVDVELFGSLQLWGCSNGNSGEKNSIVYMWGKFTLLMQNWTFFGQVVGCFFFYIHYKWSTFELNYSMKKHPQCGLGETRPKTHTPGSYTQDEAQISHLLTILPK